MKLSSDYLKLHASSCPNQIAVIDHDQEISYAKFHHDSQKVIHHFNQLSLPKGAMVAIEWTSLYPHWLTLIACEYLGLVSFSFSQDEYDLHEKFLKSCNLILGTNKNTKHPDIPYQHLTVGWLDKVLQEVMPKEIPVSQLNPTDIMRVQCSSGTTGSPKYMNRSLELHDFRIKQLLEKDCYSTESRMAICYGFPVQAAYGRASACLYAGGQVIFDTRYTMEDIANCGPTHVALMPDKIINLLNAWPKDKKLSDKFRLSTFGGKLSGEIRKACLEYFAHEIVESYGINETGSIATILSHGAHFQGDIGVILPNVIVEVLDDQDKTVLNQLGKIRIRTLGLVDGYLNDPLKTKEMFKDSWFYPGDYGIKIDDQHVKIIGRMDDLINIGGNKINASDIEEQLRPHLGDLEFCISGLIENQANEVIWVFVKPTASTNLEQVKSVLSKLASLSTSIVKFKTVDHIPRTANGKIKRREIKSLLLKN